MFIRTVLGDKSIDELGHCQCHEHIYLEKGYSAEINPVLCIDDYNKSLKELTDYYDNGGRAIVDAQPIGCGRCADKLIDLASNSKVDIIASTGFHKLIFYPREHWIYKISQGEFEELMHKEIEEGMFINCNTNYPREQIDNKAGMIKVACDKQGLDNTYKKYFAAAAAVAKKTGISIQCHIERAETGMEIVDYLLESGVSADSIILAHMDRRVDTIKENLLVAKKGIYLQYDTIGRYKYHSDEDEIALIKNMCSEGYIDNLLLGLDTTRARLLSYKGTIGLSYIRKHFIKKMMDNGFNNEQIKSLLIANPKKALAKK
ncbi:phosphotriesterase family protein [Vallitalea sp.]|jgi:phosphotriesterase-related protein|uniref:phosphotriesterase family protein n=1 Tax=Vallitalea sp. TaxID=1882829 RepID=UPI0025FB5F2A|nr:hypothetical protein [Vallitalea sp.]MCT4687346.1 hypothetical protein [Vallitalea sp.]